MRPLTATSLALALSLGGAAMVAPGASQAQIGFGVSVSVGVAPPPLPYYDQPPAPGYGYIWTPGYWAWSDYEDDYYWVPGTWVMPPRIGYLWTPPWWGWNDGAYVFNTGYWGPDVGFYGGIDYGYGYTGYGYEGGYWRGRDFFYNRTVNNIRNININNFYERPVRADAGFGRASFNGPGGAQVRPTPQQLYAARAPHLAATPVQQQHFQAARTQPALRAGFNHGAPPIAATVRPGMLRGPGVAPAVRAGGPYNAQTGPLRGPGAPQGPRYGQAPVAGQQHFNGGYRTPGAYNGGYNSAARQAPPRYGAGPDRTLGVPGAQRYGQAPVAGQERLNGGYRAPGSYNGGSNGAYRQAPHGYGQAAVAGPERFNGAARPPPGYGGGYHPVPHPSEAFNGASRPPPRPPESFGGGGFRPPPQAMARAPQQMARAPQPMPRAPQPVMRESRPAPAAPPQRREPQHP